MLDTNAFLWWLDGDRRLPARVRALAADVPACIESQGFVPLSITVHHAQRAGALVGPHRDPFDRMLIVQTQAEGVPIASNETIFDDYGVTRLW
jgi:PIN domain nuclease of toxin-antitoxin system